MSTSHVWSPGQRALLRFLEREGLLGALPDPPDGDGTPHDDALFALIAESVPPTAMAELLALRLRLPLLEDAAEPAAEASTLLTASVATRCRAVPIGLDGERLEVAVANPLDLETVKMIEFASGRRVRVRVATPDTVQSQLARLYSLPEPESAPAGAPPAMDPVVEAPGPSGEVPEPVTAAVSWPEADSEPVAAAPASPAEADPAEPEIPVEAKPAMASAPEAEAFAEPEASTGSPDPVVEEDGAGASEADAHDPAVPVWEIDAEEAATALDALVAEQGTPVSAPAPRRESVLLLVHDPVERHRLGRSLAGCVPDWIIMTAADVPEAVLTAAVVAPDVAVVDVGTDASTFAATSMAAVPRLVAETGTDAGALVVRARTLIDTARHG